MKRQKKHRLFAGAQTVSQPTPFWNIASTGENTGEILLYGDVVSSRPVHWMTGKPAEGLFITPEGFLEDLEKVKGKSSITIRINSCGGDLYTGIAIHNAIKGLSGKKTVIVEGIAASAASVIICAGDEVQIYPGSMVMVHGVSGFLYDFYSLADLKKLQKDFEASERAIAEIYHAKTGLPVEQLRTMMTRETWMVGQEAIDNGFADKLLGEQGPSMALSANKQVLLVAGIRHNVQSFHNIPSAIRISNQIQTAPAAGNIDPIGNFADGKKGEEQKTMTLEEMKAKYPQLVAQIETAAAVQERERMKAIDSIAASVGDTQLLSDAKYGEKPCTAEQLALAAMQKQAALGAAHLQGMAADARDSNADEVGGAHNDGAGEEEDETAKINSIISLYNAAKGGKKA